MYFYKYTFLCSGSDSNDIDVNKLFCLQALQISAVYFSPFDLSIILFAVCSIWIEAFSEKGSVILRAYGVGWSKIIDLLIMSTFI